MQQEAVSSTIHLCGPYILKRVIISLTVFLLQIEFKGVKMRYRPGLPLVLKGLDVCIEAGTTCGVVGRTGTDPPSRLLSNFLASLRTHTHTHVCNLTCGQSDSCCCCFQSVAQSDQWEVLPLRHGVSLLVAGAILFEPFSPLEYCLTASLL